MAEGTSIPAGAPSDGTAAGSRPRAFAPDLQGLSADNDRGVGTDAQILWRITRLALRHRARVLVAVIATVAASAFQLWVPHLLGAAVDGALALLRDGAVSRVAARDALWQTIELAEAAEEIGIDGAYVRVHHFARQLASPFPLLAAIGARTRRIEIGTAVIDMRYENPLYMAEDAAAADLIAGGRLQLGISRGSPEPALRGSESFGYVPREGQTDADMAREHARVFRHAINGAGVARSDPGMTGSSAALHIEPQSPGLSDRIWWGAGTRQTARWVAEQGMNLQSSTLISEDTGVPFGDLQAEQIEMFRRAWADAGHRREPRISVSRSVIPITTDEDRSLQTLDNKPFKRPLQALAVDEAGMQRHAHADEGAFELAIMR